MADHSKADFGWLYYVPGNPEFPTLPDGIPVPHFIEFDNTGELKTGPPVITLEKKAAVGRLYFLDYYLDGIWITPQPVEFGVITQPVQRTINIHNTARTSVQLTAIDLSAVPGLTVVSPGLPATIEAFGSITVTLEAALTGDSIFDEDIVFTVGGLDLPVRVTGRRVLIINSRPQRPIRERMSWLSDNMISVSGKEQVFQVRQAPRSTVTVEQRFTDKEKRAELLNQVQGLGFLKVGVQLWFQSREIDQAILDTDTVIQVNTENMEIQVGDLMSLVSPDYNTVIQVEVESFTATSITAPEAIGTAFPLRSSLMPLRLGFLKNQIDQASFAINAEDVRFTADLIEYTPIPNVDAAYFDFHPVDGLPIITAPLYFTGASRRESITNDIFRIDGQTGDIATVQREPLGRPTQPVLVYLASQADVHAWRRFLHFVRGSWGVFYVPTGTNDIPLKEPLLLGQNTFVTEPLGFAEIIGTQAPRRDVEVVFNGNRYFRRVNLVTATPTEETFTLSDQIPGAGSIDPADVRISWLTPSRIVGDTATFEHLRRGDAELRFQVRGVIE